MALFQKKPIAGTAAPLYTLGLNKTVLIIGLGNPDKKYEGTRHNIGFACLNEFVRISDLPAWITKKDLRSEITSGNIGSTRVICIKPITYMNLSGEAALAVLQFYKLTTSQIVAVHDELDIPFGQIRLRNGGSSAGHNGLKSLIQHLGANFGRVRIGVKNELVGQMDSADFVLQKFSRDEKAQLSSLFKETTSILTEFAVSDQLPTETRSFLA